MKNYSMIIVIGILIVLTMSQSVLGEGFVTGTLVKIPHGYIPIEQLKENDRVISYDFYNASSVEGKVIKIRQKRMSKIAQLKINDQLLGVALDHRFFCPRFKKKLHIRL